MSNCQRGISVSRSMIMVQISAVLLVSASFSVCSAHRITLQPVGRSLAPPRRGMLDPMLRLRGGGDDELGFSRSAGGRKKGERMRMNKSGSWNIDGQWSKGSQKIKYMQTQDGYGLSRARMRREKRKWKRDYGDGPDDKGQAEEDALFRDMDKNLFAPDGLADKMTKRDERQDAAAERRTKREEAARDIAKQKRKQALPDWEAKAADKLDGLAAQALKREIEREKKAPGHGHAFEVSGAGEVGANGLYLPDVDGEYDSLGKCFRNGDYLLLFEQKGRQVTNDEIGRQKLKRDRWLIFNDELGVHGNRPYYHLVGRFGEFVKPWKVVSGRGPAPTVKSMDPDLDGDDEDGSENRKKPAKGKSHREQWLDESDEEDPSGQGAAENADKDAKLWSPGKKSADDAWKALADFVKKDRKKADDDDEEGLDDDPLGVDLSEEDSIEGLDARLRTDMYKEVAHRPDDEAGTGKDVGFSVPKDDAPESNKKESDSEEPSLVDGDDSDDEVDSEDIKKRREWNEKVAKRQMEEEALMHDMIEQGMGFKEIEKELKERRGEFKGIMKIVMDSKKKAEGKPQQEEQVQVKAFWKKAPKVDLEAYSGGRVELAVMAKGPKGQKIKTTRYRTVAAALWHASELGGGIVTLAPGEYEESETLFIGGRTTLRARGKSHVIVRGPRGKTVLACDDSSGRVLVHGINLERQSRKRDPVPAVHMDTAEWPACVRISRGVVRLAECKVSGDRAVGCLVGKKGLLQLASCKIQHCGSDGAAAVAGGTIVANHTLFSRNGDNGVSAHGHGSLVRLGQCNVCNNGNNGISCIHGAKVIAKSSAFDSNKGSGCYSCGVPIVVVGVDLDYGDTVKPGAELELYDCRIRSNAEHGVQVVQHASATLVRCSSSLNSESGASVMSANMTVLRSKLINNTVHGVCVEAQGWANISMSNLSHNEQDGVGVFHLDSEAWVSACRITHNTWGVASNEKGELTLQGGENVISNNTGIDQCETMGGRVYFEYRGPIHPVLDRSRHLMNRRTTTRADIEDDSSKQWSWADRDEGELQLEYHSDDDARDESADANRMYDESATSEDYDEKMMHENKPGTTKLEEMGDVESSA